MLNEIRVEFAAGDSANKLLTSNGWRRSNRHKSELAATWWGVCYVLK